MVFDQLKLNIDVSDDEFNYIFPLDVCKLAKRHFTPVKVAITASNFLAVNKSIRCGFRSWKILYDRSKPYQRNFSWS